MPLASNCVTSTVTLHAAVAENGSSAFNPHTLAVHVSLTPCRSLAMIASAAILSAAFVESNVPLTGGALNARALSQVLWVTLSPHMIISKATSIPPTVVVANDNHSSNSACAGHVCPSKALSTLLPAFVPQFWTKVHKTRSDKEKSSEHPNFSPTDVYKNASKNLFTIKCDGFAKSLD